MAVLWVHSCHTSPFLEQEKSYFNGNRGSSSRPWLGTPTNPTQTRTKMISQLVALMHTAERASEAKEGAGLQAGPKGRKSQKAKNCPPEIPKSDKRYKGQLKK